MHTHTWSSGPWVTSGFKSNALSIRPRLPRFIKRKRWCVEHPVLMTQVASWEGHYLCSFWRIIGVWWNRYITCLKLQNTLNVTVTALAVQNKREHPSRVKGFVETVVPNYCDPTFASHFRMKIHFRLRIIHFLPPRLCYYIYYLIFIVSIRLIIIADHCCCAMIL